jgi:hypothetical protein
MGVVVLVYVPDVRRELCRMVKAIGFRIIYQGGILWLDL